MRYTLCAALLALLLATSGCDLFGPGKLTYEGTVVDAATDEPIEGIHVSLQVGGGGFGAYTTVEAGFTDQDGAFRLRTVRQDTQLYVNAPGYGGDAVYRPDYGSAGPLTYTDEARRVALDPMPR